MPTKPKTKRTAKSAAPKPAEPQRDLSPIPMAKLKAEFDRFEQPGSLSAKQLADGRAWLDDLRDAPLRQVELLRQIRDQGAMQSQQPSTPPMSVLAWFKWAIKGGIPRGDMNISQYARRLCDEQPKNLTSRWSFDTFRTRIKEWSESGLR